MQQIDKIVETWKKDFLSDACLNRCDGRLCCGRNFDLTKSDARLLFDLPEGPIKVPSPDKFQGFKKAKGKDGVFSTNFRPEGGNCPKNKDGKCTIYDHPSKPKICSDFPMMVNHEKKELMFGCVCPFTSLEHAADIYSEAIKLGYKVVNLWQGEITKKMIDDFRKQKGCLRCMR